MPVDAGATDELSPAMLTRPATRGSRQDKANPAPSISFMVLYGLLYLQRVRMASSARSTNAA
jgi:hypothetical protein